MDEVKQDGGEVTRLAAVLRDAEPLHPPNAVDRYAAQPPASTLGDPEIGLAAAECDVEPASEHGKPVPMPFSARVIEMHRRPRGPSLHWTVTPRRTGGARGADKPGRRARC